MMRNINTALILTLLACATGCERFSGPRIVGSGISKTETRETSSFQSVHLAGAYRVEITAGEPDSLTITADDNILPVIESEVKDGVLHVRTKARVKPDVPILVKIGCAEFKALDGDGAGTIKVRSVKADELTLKLSGGFSLYADGEAKTLDLTVEGAADADTSALTTTDARVSLMGAADVLVHATATLDATVTGVGSVGYVGDPEVTKSIRGIGTVEKKK